MSSTTPCNDYWYNTCVKAFDNYSEASDFVLFVEGCKSATDGVYTWETTQYTDQLLQIGCQPSDDNTYSLPTEKFASLTEIKRKARTEWHTQRQLQLKKHLSETLTLINAPLDISHDQRLALIKEFASNVDLGSVPFLRGLVGFIRYQVQNKQFVAEWTMSEYVLTQNNEVATESYVRLLRGVLGIQLVYQDDDNSDKVAIDIDDSSEEVLKWRMNPDIDNHFLQETLKCLPKDHNTTSYHITNIPRTQQSQSIFQWIYDIFTQCLSFLHQ